MRNPFALRLCGAERDGRNRQAASSAVAGRRWQPIIEILLVRIVASEANVFYQTGRSFAKG